MANRSCGWCAGAKRALAAAGAQVPAEAPVRTKRPPARAEPRAGTCIPFASSRHLLETRAVTLAKERERERERERLWLALSGYGGAACARRVARNTASCLLCRRRCFPQSSREFPAADSDDGEFERARREALNSWRSRTRSVVLVSRLVYDTLPKVNEHSQALPSFRTVDRLFSRFFAKFVL